MLPSPSLRSGARSSGRPGPGAGSRPGPGARPGGKISEVTEDHQEDQMVYLERSLSRDPSRSRPLGDNSG